MVKTELHAHTADDEADRIGHTTEELIARAASLGYGALAITLHDRQLDPEPFRAFARKLGVVLISGVERTIERTHVLLINFPADAERIRSWKELRDLKRRVPQGIVVVPHPFYPVGSAAGGRLLAEHADLVDALELNAMYTWGLDFNRRAVAWARAHGKPLVGNTDLHLLPQMGTTFSLVDAAPEPDAICEAIRAGRVQVRTAPLPPWRAGWFFARMLIGGLRARRRRPRHE